MFEILGAAGIAISMLAYLPQVVHLAKEHCSAGVSSRAWSDVARQQPAHRDARRASP